MTFKTALRTLVKADATVIAKGGRVYWTSRPQGSALPAVVLQTIAGAADQHMGGVMGSQPCRVQATAFARTQEEADSLRIAVQAAMIAGGTFGSVTFQRGFLNLNRDGVDNTSTGEVFHDICDVTIWFN